MSYVVVMLGTLGVVLAFKVWLGRMSVPGYEAALLCVILLCGLLIAGLVLAMAWRERKGRRHAGTQGRREEDAWPGEPL